MLSVLRIYKIEYRKNNECGAVGVMRIVTENWSTQDKTQPSVILLSTDDMYAIYH